MDKNFTEEWLNGKIFLSYQDISDNSADAPEALHWERHRSLRGNSQTIYTCVAPNRILNLHWILNTHKKSVAI